MKPIATHSSLILTGADADTHHAGDHGDHGDTHAPATEPSTALPTNQASQSDQAPVPKLTGQLNFDQVKNDRRRAPRQVVEELVTAVFHDGPDRVLVSRVLLTDVSHTGLGCACEKPLAPGAKVTLTSRGVPMPHKSGTVVRCRAVSGGFLLGVSLDRQRAVA
jgi:hypothetical protein